MSGAAGAQTAARHSFPRGYPYPDSRDKPRRSDEKHSLAIDQEGGGSHLAGAYGRRGASLPSRGHGDRGRGRSGAWEAPLIPDLEIYRAAKLLVDQHGEDAPIRAAERADELLESGDFEGAAIWRSILAAIEELQRGRLDGESVN